MNEPELSSDALAARLEALAWWDWDHERLRQALSDFRGLAVEDFLDRHEASPIPERGQASGG